MPCCIQLLYGASRGGPWWLFRYAGAFSTIPHCQHLPVLRTGGAGGFLFAGTPAALGAQLGGKKSPPRSAATSLKVFFIPPLPQPARPWQQSPSVLCSTPPAHGEGLPRASFSQGASPSRASGDFPALDNYSRAPEPAYFCPAAAQLGSEPAASLQLNYKQTKPFVTAAQRGLCLRFFP